MRLVSLIIIVFLSCSLYGQKVEKYGWEDLEKLPPPPDYSDLYYWASHPTKDDAGDEVPGKDQLTDNQENALVDVFFVHPTIYSGKQDSKNPWNANLADVSLNREVDGSTIKNQASVFNGSARVFAPRYRQAHINVFRTMDQDLKKKALDNAYKDVKAAFEYYLNNEDDGRPVIIAGHSQGTLHAARLLKEFFNTSLEMRQRLVAAYIIGMPLTTDLFEHIPPCENKDQTGCWINWNTYVKGYYPPEFRVIYKDGMNVNPLNWKIDGSYASRDENKGGVLRNYKRIIPRLTDAQNYNGILWVQKPYFFWRFLLRMKRYHIADYNLFYMNIRENVANRIDRYTNHSSNSMLTE